MSDVRVVGPGALSDYLSVCRRRKWILLAVPVLTAVTTFVLSSSQRAVFQATAQMLVNESNVVSAIANISDPTLSDPARFLSTEASIAR